MSKIGRNEPCPCGSGKKYKNCCIDKPLQSVAQSGIRQGAAAVDFKRYIDSFWSYDEVDDMATDEIVEKLESMGIAFNEEEFRKDAERYYSAEQLSEAWFDTFHVTAIGRDEDFPMYAAWVLWDRLAPKYMASMETMGAMMDAGYDSLEESDSVKACDIWMKLWNTVKFRVKSESKNLDFLDQQYSSCFFIRNICQDMEHELRNAGLVDMKYFTIRIDYCREFCSLFPDEDERILHNMRRAIAESFLSLDKIKDAENEFAMLIEDYPEDSWSYIACGDMYWLDKCTTHDPVKAREFYEVALAKAKDYWDKEAAEERLEDIDRAKEANE